MIMANSKKEANPTGFGDVFEVKAPDISLVEAVALVKHHYGLVGRASALNSERDHNFQIETERHGKFVLKIAHPAETIETVDFQTAALMHIAAVDPDLGVPAVRPTMTGDLHPVISIRGDEPRITRLLTYLPGRILATTEASAQQDRNLGVFLARLGRALRGFYHCAAAGSDLLWDIRKVAKARPLLVHIKDHRRRDILDRCIDEYERDVAHLAPGLRAQIVHNDMNPNNVVVDPASTAMISGILDFGDMLHSPLICDVAVGAIHRWTPDEHPLAGAARFVSGYQSVQPLEEIEIGLLLDFMRARLTLTAAVVQWQAERFPEKRDYVLRRNAEIWSSIESLSEISRNSAHSYFLQKE
jgi:Ser/Thr protein kinase RdoA (MazF antagonist)